MIFTDGSRLVSDQSSAELSLFVRLTGIFLEKNTLITVHQVNNKKELFLRKGAIFVSAQDVDKILEKNKSKL